jgi:hypothetical protein
VPTAVPAYIPWPKNQGLSAAMPFLHLLASLLQELTVLALKAQGLSLVWRSTKETRQSPDESPPSCLHVTMFDAYGTLSSGNQPIRSQRRCPLTTSPCKSSECVRKSQTYLASLLPIDAVLFLDFPACLGLHHGSCPVIFLFSLLASTVWSVPLLWGRAVGGLFRKIINHIHLQP